MAETERVKVLGICGSARHASTEWGVKLALEAAESLGYVDTEFINLGDYKLTSCTGCMKCFGWQHPADAVSPYCYEHNDDAGAIMAKMMENDGYLLGTPVYTLGMSSLTRILQEKAHQFGPESFTKFSGALRYRPLGVVTVGGVDTAGQEAVAQDIWIWCMAIGLVPVTSWPTVDDPNPVAATIGGLVSTCDSGSIYAKNALSKAMCRTIPPTQGSRNERALRNVGRQVGYAAKMLKLGIRAFKETGDQEPRVFPFNTYSVKPKKNSWVQHLIDEGKVQFRPKVEIVDEKNAWEE